MKNKFEEMTEEELRACINNGDYIEFETFVEQMNQKIIEMNGGIDPFNPPYPSEVTRSMHFEFNEDNFTAVLYGDPEYIDAEYIGIPESVVYKGNKYRIIEIGENAFKGFRDLRTFCTSDTIEKIGQRAFFGCKNLTTIILSHDLTEVADNAFKGCNKLERLIINKYGTPKSCKQASTWDEFIRKIIKEAHKSK